RAADNPRHVLRTHLVLVLQEAARPDCGRHLVVTDADAPAFELARLAERRAGAHVERVLAEDARGEHGDGDEALVAFRTQDGVGGERHFRDVELLVVQHAPEGLAGPQREVGELVDALDLHASVEQRLSTVEAPASQCQSHALKYSWATCASSLPAAASAG